MSLLSDSGKQFRALYGWSGITAAEIDLEGGQGSIDGIPPGLWRIHVTSTDGRTWDGEAQVTANAVTDAVVK